jgi:hypothetical protein
MSKMVMAKAPRRFGKSVAVGMAIVAFAIVMSDTTQSIFSTGRRASKNLLEICYKQLVDLGLGSWEAGVCGFFYLVRLTTIKKSGINQENLFIKNPFTGRISKIFSYPSNPKIGTVTLTALCILFWFYFICI